MCYDGGDHENSLKIKIDGKSLYSVKIANSARVRCLEEFKDLKLGKM